MMSGYKVGGHEKMKGNTNTSYLRWENNIET
jgi:hypothetical protein